MPGRGDLELRLEQATQALERADDPEQPVEIVRAEPVLEVSRRKGGLELRLAPSRGASAR